MVSVNRRQDNRIGSVGMPLDCCQARIAAPDKNGIGEIQINGNNVMRGYYGDAQETREAFTEDGWLKTGDLGYQDKNQYLYVTGRIKHLIILSNGKNVSPEELEEKVKMIPGVTETAVYAKHDQIIAEVYAENSEPQIEDAIRVAIHEINRGLPMYKHIGQIKFRDTEFQKTTTMKIKKHSLGGNHA